MVYFKEDEFSCFEKLDKEMLERLDWLREMYGKPFIVRGHSDYRPQTAWEKVRGIKPDVHALGIAVDFHVADGKKIDKQAELLHEFCLSIGKPFRLGAYPFWNNPGFHFDTLDISKDRTKLQFWVQNKEGIYVFHTTYGGWIDEIKTMAGIK